MTAPALQDPHVTPFPPGPAPAMPTSMPPDEATPGPTLAGAVVGDLTKATSAAPAPEEPAPPPLTPEQIIGLVSEVSAFGLPAGLADAYKADFRSNSLVQLGVQFSGLSDALAAYGVTGAGGKMPEWLSVMLGVAVLGYGVYSTRSKYAPLEPAAGDPAPAADAGFTGPGYGTALSTSDFGFSGSGEGGAGEQAAAL